jgi:hypothetical protein
MASQYESVFLFGYGLKSMVFLTDVFGVIGSAGKSGLLLRWVERSIQVTAYLYWISSEKIVLESWAQKWVYLKNRTKRDCIDM